MAASGSSGTRSLVFIDNVTADIESKTNCDVDKAILSAQIQPNAELIRQFHIQGVRRHNLKNCAAVQIFMDPTVTLTQFSFSSSNYTSKTTPEALPSHKSFYICATYYQRVVRKL